METRPLRVADEVDALPRTGPSDERPHVVVVGGGISGLAAAWALVRDHAAAGLPVAPRVTVVEGSPDVGGKLRLGELAGIPIDVGAESLLATRPEALTALREVGLTRDVVHPATTSALLWNRGVLRHLPAGLVMGVPTDLRALGAAEVIAWPSLLRIPLDHVLPRTAPGHDVSVGSYVASRLGREVVDRLVEPLLGGVYAGHADLLSFDATVPTLFRAVQGEKSLLSAAREVQRTGAGRAGGRRGPVFAGVRGGVGRLPQSMAAALAKRGVEIRTSTTVRELRRRPDRWRLVLGPARSPEVIDADAVILAVPAAAAARLLREVSPIASAELATIEYASMAVVTLAYRERDLAPLVGSGFLVPPVDGHAVKAATFSSNKWDWVGKAGRHGHGRDPLVLVRASLGRHGEEVTLQADDDDLVALAHGDIAAAVGASARPVAASVTRWGGGLPQYAVGHRARVARVRDAVSELPGLAVCGAAYDGVGVAACLGTSSYAAGRVGRWLEQRRQWSHG
jgi:oxygen-dependent protoporphyrinogen oxidase